MYAFDWMRQRAPMTVSFSTQTPRPTTLPSPTVTRSRMSEVADDEPAPSVTPADTTAPVDDRRAVADHERRERLAPGGGRAAQRGLLADHGVVADADAGADHRARRR